MELLLWICLPLSVAAGSALLTYMLMRDRASLAVERERQVAREARIMLDLERESLQTRIAAAEERARRLWLEDLLAGRIPGAAVAARLGDARVREPTLLETGPVIGPNPEKAI